MKILDRITGRSARAQERQTARIEPQLSASANLSSGTSQPEGWLREIGFGGQSRVRSLPHVSPDIMQRHATVFACCNIIAGDMSKVPVKLYQRDLDGKETRVRDHPAAYLLNVESSPGVAAITARFALNYAFCLRGRAYAFAPRDGAGELMMIDTIKQQRVAELNYGRRWFYDFEDGDGVQRRAPSRSMLHMRYMAEDGWTGRSPLEVAAESMGLALAGQEAAARAASGTQMRAFLKMEDVYDDDEDFRRNALRVRNALNDPEANGIPIIGSGDDITSLDLSAADQELLSSRKFDREQIAAIYRVPPSKLQLLEHGVKANGQQQAIDYKSDCLLHWAGFIEGQMRMGLLTEAERRGGMFFRHDFNALLQSTTKERYDALIKAVGGPFMTWKEARELDGLPDLPEGELPYPPPNMTRDDKPEEDDET